MLALSFFVSVFATAIWLIYSFMYIGETLSGVSMSSLGMTDLLTYIIAVTLPLFVLWSIFGYVIQFSNLKSSNNSLLALFKQMKKNQEYTDLVARIMLEAEQGIKDGFILNKFDLFVSDMNELIAEIVYRGNLASNEQIERLWDKVKNGGKWAFGKVIVEVNASQPTFQKRIIERAQGDVILAGTVLEFTSRYLSLIALLEKHDKDRIFLNILETGVFGKVFSILAPVSDEVKRTREVSFSGISSRSYNEDVEFTTEFSAAPSSVFPPHLEMEPVKEPFSAKLNPFKKKEHSDNEPVFEKEKDPFSVALERSFSPTPAVAPVIVEEREPTFDEHPTLNAAPQIEEMPDIVLSNERTAPEPQLTSTQKALDDLKDEWKQMGAVIEPKLEEAPKPEKKYIEEASSYPFAGWTDEDNYVK